MSCTPEGEAGHWGRREAQQEVEMADDRDIKRSGREDQVEGGVDELKGKARGKTGELRDDRSQQAKGKGEELKGKAQRKFGEAKESLSDSMSDRDSDRTDRDA
jgi:uncharacterized protein YjbJ (UPF0337 family)